MKIPVIRSSMGVWNYYIATLSFSEIARYVTRLDTEIPDLKVKNMTNEKVTEIKEYLLTQEERLFNSLILAVYDGDPQWIEVELHYKDEDFFNMALKPMTLNFGPVGSLLGPRRA